MPSEFLAEHEELTLDSFRLDEQELRLLGLVVSKKRQALTLRANNLSEKKAANLEDTLHEVSNLNDKVQRRSSKCIVL